MKFNFFKRHNNAESLSSNFTEHIQKAIILIGRAEKSFQNEELVEHLLANGIPHKEAIEIYLFLPVAFIREHLPTFTWSDIYFETGKDKKLVERKFSDTQSFLKIMAVVCEYFKGSPQQDEVLKIAGRSAEFQVMNKLLLSNPELRIKDIQLTPLVITR